MKSSENSIIKGVLACSILIAAKAFAVKPYAPSPSEIRMLPPYCVAKLGADKNAIALWQQRLGGENFGHIHHYCFALNFMNRARFESDPSNRKYYLQSAISDFDYVISRWSPKFQLTIAAKNYKAQAQSMLRQ